MLDDPFDMFCLYYLGLNPQGEYRFHNANQIAREYNWSVQELLRHLSSMNLHPDQVVNTDFPLARYQVDVQIAAETANGLQLRSLARKIYEEFLRAKGRPRDWLSEIQQEQQEDNKPSN